MKSTRPNDDPLDALVRTLFRIEDGEASSDELFLAGFRRKLRLSQKRSISSDLRAPSLGEWCWKVSPVTALATLLLIFSFWNVVPETEPIVEAPEQVLWSLLDENGVEWGGDEFLEIVSQESRR